MTPSDDLLHRFIFDNTDIRGEIVSLQTSLKKILGNHQYPAPVKQLLGEFAAAAALLSSTLKFDGTLTLQARGDGPVPLIMAEADHDKNLRGIVKFTEDLPEDLNLVNALGKGALVITLDPDKGNRYQGIVPLEGPTLADCLEEYFAQSEQLPTRFWLVSNGETASGLLLQRLPQQEATAEENQLAWENRVQLANTITPDELTTLSHPELLTRLFHEEGVRLFDPTKLRFQCSCSEHRSLQAIKHLGKEDAMALISERGSIDVDCDFCGHHYQFALSAIETLFAPETRH